MAIVMPLVFLQPPPHGKLRGQSMALHSSLGHPPRAATHRPSPSALPLVFALTPYSTGYDHGTERLQIYSELLLQANTTVCFGTRIRTKQK